MMDAQRIQTMVEVTPQYIVHIILTEMNLSAGFAESEQTIQEPDRLRNL